MTGASAEPLFVTTPIYYVNDRPHIGHCYTTLVADVLARAQRLIGRDVFFLTGTDEHADKVARAATEHGKTPIEWADENAARFHDAFEFMGFSNDDFVRTTEDRHKARASAYIQKLVELGEIELGDYEGWYDPSQEEYVTESTAKENDFNSPVTGKPLEKRVEQNYFFRLSKHAAWLEEEIVSDRLRVLPEARKNEVLGRIRQGLQDVPVSRKIRDDDPPEIQSWGVRMPGDEAHRVYVWIEALCNYLTIIDNEREPATANAEGGSRRKWWPTDGQGAAPIAHLMAKDILWFHAVIWPCMLRALGERPPQLVYAHGYWIAEGRKMSKSLGNFIEIDLLKKYAEKFSLDAVRWFLTTQGPLGATDADFAHARFVEIYNTDLANGVGNSTSRVGNMIGKYLDGACDRLCDGRFGFPEGKALQIALKAREAAGKPAEDPTRTFEFAVICAEATKTALESAETVALDRMLSAGLSIVRAVDDFISYAAPFTLAKQFDDFEHGPKALSTILYSCAEALRVATVLLSPAMPQKMADLWKLWSCEHLNDPNDPDSGFVAPLSELAQFGGPHAITVGQKIEKGDALFMRADPKEDAPSV